jgi:hypothetical protein
MDKNINVDKAAQDNPDLTREFVEGIAQAAQEKSVPFYFNEDIDKDIKAFKNVINDFFTELHSNDPCCIRIRLRDVNTLQIILGKKYNINTITNTDNRYMDFYNALIELRNKNDR